MSKLLLLSICASLALTSMVWLRTRSIIQLHPSNDNEPLDPHQHDGSQRLLSAYEMKGWKFFNDPRSIISKDDSNNNEITISQEETTILEPLHICERMPQIPHELDLEIMQKYYSKCHHLMSRPPEETTVLVVDGMQAYGRTGNRLIEFLHSFQFGEDYNVLVAIKQGTWATHLIPDMWMAIQGDDMSGWIDFMEEAFCVKFFTEYEELDQYQRRIKMDPEALFKYRHRGPDLDQYIEFQGHIIRTLWRNYNYGVGFNMRHKPVRDMCSVVNAIFGEDKQTAVYSVIHSRSLEGEPGLRILGRICRKLHCDPVAALEMEPEYVKSILAPLGMLEHPILFVSDHQRPEILERLLADPDIGPNIHLIPNEASWVGGDVTAAVMATVFIGNPASTFTGFIAKSRVALGFDENYLFRKKKSDGEWVDVCDGRCIFDRNFMFSMA